MEKKTLMLLFSIDSYDRFNLDGMNSQELFELSKQGNYNVLIYTIKEFCEASNNEDFSNNNYWIYTATIAK